MIQSVVFLDLTTIRYFKMMRVNLHFNTIFLRSQMMSYILELITIQQQQMM